MHETALRWYEAMFCEEVVVFLFISQDIALFDNNNTTYRGARSSDNIRRRWVEVDHVTLRWHGAHGARNAQPVRQVCKRLWHMQYDAPRRTLDPDAYFEQPITQRAHLSSRTLSTATDQLQFLEQHVSGSRQQHAQLISQEIRAAGAIDLQTMVQLSR